jgi:hypothetical protein
MICPKCEKHNNCPCSSCNAKKKLKNTFTWVDAENGIIQCYFCGTKFPEQASFDYEWDQMILNYTMQLSPQLCQLWFDTIKNSENKDRSSFYKKWGFDEFAFKMAFRSHFKKDPYNLNVNDWQQIKRDFNINSILNQSSSSDFSSENNSSK